MRRRWIWGAGAVALVVVAAVVASFFVDEPLRRSLERQLHARLQGYTVRIGALDLHPLGFSVDVKDITLTQDTHPDPPVARVPQLSASVQWRALLQARMVVDVQVERPALHLHHTQLVQAARDEVPAQERGWQEAVQAVSPLQIHEARIVEGEVTYIHRDLPRPVHLRQLNVRAGNIRNVQSAAGVYPSDLHVDGALADSGTFRLEGQADFLAVPHLAVKAQVALEQIALAPFRPVASRYNLDLRRGTLSASGDLEYAPTVRIVHLRQLTIERPALHLHHTQLVQAARDEVPAQERGWQEAVQAVSPLQIHEARIVEGEVTYIHRDLPRPVHLRQLNVRAGNIRNVQSAAGVYPSDLHVDGALADSGTFRLEGQADFLAVPHLAVKAQVALEQIALAPFRPVASRYNLDLRRGTLSASGDLEYAPTVRIVHLRQLTIERLQADYIHTSPTAVVEQRRVRQVKPVAQEVSNVPGVLLRADQLRLVKSTLGFVNRAAQPNYRLFLDGAEVHVHNFSNQLTEGTAAAKVTGKFMGSGRTVVGASLRPETKGPDFALAASIEDTQMPALNPLLRAYGKVDVAGGFFSVYTEMRVQNRAVQGYVKPLIRELDVYDTRQDREKNLFQQLYEAVVGGISEVLETLPRDEAATKVDIAGPLDNPQASTWQVLVTLIPNAFHKAILPGFERELGRGGRGALPRAKQRGSP